ncbi:hypothetical protein FRC07_009993, partial [Ceratobasidium sp. 392]
MAAAVLAQRPNIKPAEPIHPKGAENKDCGFAMLSARVHSVVVDEMNVFYREAGRAGRPVILLLHGGIASSFQFRQLMPLLAREF